MKRMLMYMKSTVEGMRMLCLFLAYHEDVMHMSPDSKSVSVHQRVSSKFLHPSSKPAFPIPRLVTAEAMQVYGGYGYCQEYPVEQYARDTKVFLLIYEGTNAIQSLLDLQMRKILMNSRNV